MLCAYGLSALEHYEPTASSIEDFNQAVDFLDLGGHLTTSNVAATHIQKAIQKSLKAGELEKYNQGLGYIEQKLQKAAERSQ